MGEMGRSWKGTPHGIGSLILHAPMVVNVISSRVVLQLFFPSSYPLLRFFHLNISRQVLDIL